MTESQRLKTLPSHTRCEQGPLGLTFTVGASLPKVGWDRRVVTEPMVCSQPPSSSKELYAYAHRP